MDPYPGILTSVALTTYKQLNINYPLSPILTFQILPFLYLAGIELPVPKVTISTS